MVATADDTYIRYYNVLYIASNCPTIIILQEGLQGVSSKINFRLLASYLATNTPM